MNFENILLENKIKVKRTQLFKEQVKYLCSKISSVEWSGVLFYTSKGFFPNLEIELQEIFLMDKGSSTYTEYNYDQEIVEYQMNNPHLLNYKIGHIHSHNNMGTFFSGTDSSELNENCLNHVYYLSVIVNNAGSICGKVAIISETEQPTKFSIRNEIGKILSLNFKKREEKKIILIADCEFDTTEDTYNFKEDFIKRVETVVNKPIPTTSYFRRDNDYEFPYSYSHPYNPYPNIKNDNISRNEHGVNRILGKKEDLSFEDLDDDDIIQFFAYFLTNGKFSYAKESKPSQIIQSIINAYKLNTSNVDAFVNSVVANYENNFNTFFKTFANKNNFNFTEGYTMKFLIELTEYFIDEYLSEDFTTKNSFLAVPLTQALSETIPGLTITSLEN